eukprot:2624687-Rhodomonas_salina.1
MPTAHYWYEIPSWAYWYGMPIKASLEPMQVAKTNLLKPEQPTTAGAKYLQSLPQLGPSTAVTVAWQFATRFSTGQSKTKRVPQQKYIPLSARY